MILNEERLKDLHYVEGQALKQKNNVVAGLETEAEHCEALNSIPDTAALSLLNATLYELEGMRNGSESPLLKKMETQDYICGRWERPDQMIMFPEVVQLGENTKSICVSLLF